MDYKADILSYYPEFLQETEEYKAICEAVNPEFDLLFQRVQQTINNIVPQTSDTKGITDYEQWLGLRSDPTLSLEERQAQVIAKLNETLPYTEIRLQRILAAIVGWGHFRYERHGAFVRVILDSDSGACVVPVRDALERILPLNLHFEVVLRHVEAASLIDFASYGQETVVIETVIDPAWNTGIVYYASPYLEKAYIETEIGE